MARLVPLPRGTDEPPHVGEQSQTRFMFEAGYVLCSALSDAAERLEREGKTAVFAGWDRRVRGVLVSPTR